MIGQTISHYKILEKLGEGGMGVVYKAEDLTLGRIVALKFLPTGSIASSQDRARLMHEARAAAALLHPNICPVYEIAETQDRTFIAMAYLDGRNLRDRLTEGPLSVEEALRIIRQVGEALAAAHAKGIVHRDVKPANIMLTNEGQAVLMDFGLAKMSDATKLTKTGMTLGTARYMSPEQALAEDVDLRTDVWSLAAVLYELLAGKPAFPGDYEQAVIYRILHESPGPISIYRSDIPTGIEGVLESALRKNPRERYASVRDFLADLESHGQQSGEHGSRSGRPASNLLKHPRRIAATLLVIAITAVGVWLLLGRDRPLQGADMALAVIDFEDLGGSSDTLSAVGLGGLLQVGLIERSPIRVVSPEYLRELHRRLFNGAMAAIKPEQAMEVARKAGATYLLAGQIGHAQGSTYAIWRLVETGHGRSVGGRRIVNSDLVGLADGIIAEVVPLIAKQTKIKVPTAIGSVDQITSASPEALRHFTAAEEALKKDKGDDALRELEAAVRIDSTFALAWLRIADIYFLRTQFVHGREYAEKAWALRARLGIKDRMMLESRRLQLDRRITAALEVYREMMSRWPDDHTILKLYGNTLLWWWFDIEAQLVAEQALERYPDDEELRSMRENALLMQGKTTEALTSAREYRRRHPEDPEAWDRVGVAHIAGGGIDSAEAAFRRGDSIKPNDMRFQYNMACCAFLRGDTDGARAILERLLARTDLSVGWRYAVQFGWPFYGVSNPGLVDCYAETGRLSRALDMVDKYGRSIDSKDIESLIQVEHVRSKLFLDWGRPRQVLAMARGLSEIRDVDYARDFALLYRTEALVALDSLPAARKGLAQIREMKDKYGVFIRQAPQSIAARISLAEGRPDSALAQIERVGLASRPRDWDMRVRALRDLKRLPEAAATLEELLRLDGSRFIARYQLGQIYEELGRKAEAAEQYRIFLKAWEHADPGWPQVEDARKRLAAL